MRPLSIIVAVDEHGGFGKDGKIPWYFPDDLKHFKKITGKQACIMGRKTYEDMLEMVLARKKDKTAVVKDLLPGRDCYVVSSTLTEATGATVVPNIRKAVELTEKHEVFVIGGEKMFTEALPWVNTIYMTVVKGDYECDRVFPIKYVQQKFAIAEGERGSDDLLFMKYNRKSL